MTNETPPASRPARLAAPTLKQLASQRLVEFPTVKARSRAQLAKAAPALVSSPPPAVVMTLSARKPFGQRGYIDVYKPGRWDCETDQIFLDPLVVRSKCAALRAEVWESCGSRRVQGTQPRLGTRFCVVARPSCRRPSRHTAPTTGPVTSITEPARPRGSCRAGLQRAVGALDDARHFDARCDSELAEGVAEVGLDRLRAEKELCRDLRIGLSIDDESSDLEFSLGE